MQAGGRTARTNGANERNGARRNAHTSLPPRVTCAVEVTRITSIPRASLPLPAPVIHSPRARRDPRATRTNESELAAVHAPLQVRCISAVCIVSRLRADEMRGVGCAGDARGDVWSLRSNSIAERRVGCQGKKEVGCAEANKRRGSVYMMGCGKKNYNMVKNGR
jgi:hypothetical protein